VVKFICSSDNPTREQDDLKVTKPVVEPSILCSNTRHPDICDYIGGSKVRDLPFQSMPEKGRRNSIIGTNRYWPELHAVKKRILGQRDQDDAEVMHV
jgi:hypothetical protein